MVPSITPPTSSWRNSGLPLPLAQRGPALRADNLLPRPGAPMQSLTWADPPRHLAKRLLDEIIRRRNHLPAVSVQAPILAGPASIRPRQSRAHAVGSQRVSASPWWRRALELAQLDDLRNRGSLCHHPHALAFACRALDREATWTSSLSPYETLGVDRNATTEDIKSGYRRMAKTFHPDVYNGNPPLQEDETAESRFIQIQAAYELLVDEDQRRQYDLDNRTNPNKASKAWRDWVLRKRKAFEQRGEVALSAWAEQQQREMSLKARQLSKAKTDPEEERRLMMKQKAATIDRFEKTLQRHTLVLKKRDLERQKADEANRKRLVADLLSAEGLELELEDE